MLSNATRRIHRSFVVLVIVSVLFGAVALPAEADRPDEFTDEFSIVSTNPCTGGPHYIDFVFDVAIHEHNNNFVVHVAATGTAEPGGYTLKGINHFVENSNVIIDHFNHIFSNDDGSKYVASGRFMLQGGEVKMDTFVELRCISGPTISS